MVEEHGSHLSDVERKNFALCTDQHRRESRRMSHCQLVEDIWVTSGQVSDGSAGGKYVLEYLDRDLTWLSDLVGANGGQAKFLSRLLHDEFENTVRSVALYASLFADRRDEEALGIG